MDLNPKIKALIFDLGGVLVDLDWDRCVNNFRNLGVDSIENLISTTHQKGFILDYELGFINDNQFRNEVRKIANSEIPDKLIDDAWLSLLVGIPEEKLELLLSLKKDYRILMLSNTNKMSFEHCRNIYFNFRHHSINDFFDHCYLSYEMHLCKPSNEIFDTMLRNGNLAPNEVLFLDDGDKNIEAAKNRGINVLKITPYTSISEWGLFEILKELNG